MNGDDNAGYFDFAGWPDARYRFFPDKYPYRCVGRIEIWGVKNGWVTNYLGYNPGVGTLVGPRTVATAAHCVPWDIFHQFVIRFVPAYYDGRDATDWFGYFSGLGYFVDWYWTNQTTPPEQGGSIALDAAVLNLDYDAGHRYGWLGYGSLGDNHMDQAIFAHVGYPWLLHTAYPDEEWIYLWELTHDYDNQHPLNPLGPNDIPPNLNGNNVQFTKRPAVQFKISFHDADPDSGGLVLESYDAYSTKGDSGGPYFAWFDDAPTPGWYVMGVTSGTEVEGVWGDSNVVAAGGDALSNLINAHRE